MFKKGKTDLLEIKSIHELPGRIRFHCEALYYIREFNEEILNSLLSTNMIKKASINNITKNMLIYYDNTKLDKKDLVKIISEILSNYTMFAYKQKRKEDSKDIVTREREEDVKDIGKRLIINTSLIGYSCLKNNHIINTNLPIYNRFLNIPALGALYLTKSLFKDGIGGLIKNKRPNADTLTISSIIASILVGNSSSALTIILL